MAIITLPFPTVINVNDKRKKGGRAEVVSIEDCRGVVFLPGRGASQTANLTPPPEPDDDDAA